MDHFKHIDGKRHQFIHVDFNCSYIYIDQQIMQTTMMQKDMFRWIKQHTHTQTWTQWCKRVYSFIYPFQGVDNQVYHTWYAVYQKYAPTIQNLLSLDLPAFENSFINYIHINWTDYITRSKLMVSLVTDSLHLLSLISFWILTLMPISKFSGFISRCITCFSWQ